MFIRCSKGSSLPCIVPPCERFKTLRKKTQQLILSIWSFPKSWGLSQNHPRVGKINDINGTHGFGLPYPRKPLFPHSPSAEVQMVCEGREHPESSLRVEMLQQVLEEDQASASDKGA